MLDLENSQLVNDIKLFALFDYGHVFAKLEQDDDLIEKLHEKVIGLIDESELMNFKKPSKEKVVKFLMDMGHFTRFKNKLFNIGTMEMMYNDFSTSSVVDLSNMTEIEVCEYMLNDGVYNKFIDYVCGA